MLTVVDSGTCNLDSVAQAFRRVGARFRITADAGDLVDADAIVLPGVGAFGDAMASLAAKDMIAPLRAAAAAGTPLLGICLGMQLLADESAEFGCHAGLGLVPGRVMRLAPARTGERVPNVGWCDVAPRPRSRLFDGIGAATSFYFVHGYHLVCAEPADSVATIDYGEAPVTVAVERGNLFGIQFHPELSQDAGLDLLAAFVHRVQGRA